MHVQPRDFYTACILVGPLLLATKYEIRDIHAICGEHLRGWGNDAALRARSRPALSVPRALPQLHTMPLNSVGQFGGENADNRGRFLPKKAASQTSLCWTRMTIIVCLLPVNACLQLRPVLSTRFNTATKGQIIDLPTETAMPLQGSLQHI